MASETQYWIVTGSESYYGPYGSRVEAEKAAKADPGIDEGRYSVERYVGGPGNAPPLVWSSEPPKVKGNYHIEYGRNHKDIEYFSEKDIRERAWRPGALRFAGPIPEPVEPEGGE